MLFDLQSLFSDQQAVTATAASTNVIDLGAVDTPKHAVGPITRDIGRGRPIPIVIQVTEAFTAVGAATLTVDLEVDDDVAFGSAKTVASITVAKADLVAGKRISPFYVPQGVDERYVRLNYTVTTGPMTAGKLTAGLVFGDDGGGWSA